MTSATPSSSDVDARRIAAAQPQDVRLQRATTSTGRRASARTSTAARDAGVNLAFFSGNEVFWKTRWAASIGWFEHAVSDVDHLQGDAFRRSRPIRRTRRPGPGTWADPRFSPPADGGKPANALTGQVFVVNSGTTDITVPSQYSKLRLWRNTAVANLTSGQTLTLGAGIGTLGYEWDVDADNGFRPAGLIDLSSTTVSGAAVHRLRHHDRQQPAPRPTT